MDGTPRIQVFGTILDTFAILEYLILATLLKIIQIKLQMKVHWYLFQLYYID